jgi:hypothetical protein
LLEQLRAGEAVEVGGYLLAAELAGVIEELRLENLVPPCQSAWIEVGAEAPSCFGSASQSVLDAWIEQGCGVHSSGVVGQPFWLTQEITECPALLDATAIALDRIAP